MAQDRPAPQPRTPPHAADSDCAERRRHRRWNLAIPLAVFQRDGRLLGHVVNLSESGMMLLSVEAVELSRHMTLMIEVPGRGGDSLRLRMVAVGRWVELDQASHTYFVGFEFLIHNPELLKATGGLLDDAPD